MCHGRQCGGVSQPLFRRHFGGQSGIGRAHSNGGWTGHVFYTCGIRSLVPNDGHHRQRNFGGVVGREQYDNVHESILCLVTVVWVWNRHDGFGSLLTKEKGQSWIPVLVCLACHGCANHKRQGREIVEPHPHCSPYAQTLLSVVSAVVHGAS